MIINLWPWLTFLHHWSWPFTLFFSIININWQLWYVAQAVCRVASVSFNPPAPYQNFTSQKSQGIPGLQKPSQAPLAQLTMQEIEMRFLGSWVPPHAWLWCRQWIPETILELVKHRRTPWWRTLHEQDLPWDWMWLHDTSLWLMTGVNNGYMFG